MGAHSCSLKEPIKLLTQKGAPLSRKVLLPMLTAKVLTPDLVALYGKYFKDNYRLVERVKFDVARATELFRTDVAALVSEVARQEKYIEMQVDLIPAGTLLGKSGRGGSASWSTLRTHDVK